MAKVVIYTTSYCPYCFGAKALLRSKNVEFEEIDVTDDPTQRAEMERLSAENRTADLYRCASYRQLRRGPALDAIGG